MDVRLTTEAGRAVALKRTTAVEVDRLRRAAHPGVVELLGAGAGSEGVEIRLAHAGVCLAELPSLSVEQVAAIIAAVADTVADLHQLGVVHGRIDATHVLIANDGQPRLCGLSGPEGVAPAEDVLGLGVLLTQLLGTEDAGDAIPDRRVLRRRARADGMYLRRALLTLADQACADEPSHRPTARRLAASLAAAVPGAHLSALAVTDDSIDQPIDAHAPPRRTPLAAARLLAITAVGLLLIVGGVRALGNRTAAVALPSVSVPSGSEPPPTTSSAAAGAPTTIAPAARLTECRDGGIADVDGDGCPDALTVEGSVVTIGADRYQVGEEGDLVAIGDWDCDGTSTPAALRPTTAEVFLFQDWAPTGTTTVSAVDRVAGAVGMVVTRLGAGCDGLAVENALGDRTIVWPTPGAPR